MNELSSELDRKDDSAQCKPRIHQGRNRGHGQRQNGYGSRDRSYSRERELYNSGRNRRNYQNGNNYGNRGYRPRNGDYQTNNRHNDRPSYRKENFNQDSPHQEGIITEMYESPDKSYLEQPQELMDLVDRTRLIHKYLPKQVDIDRSMGIIIRKVLNGTQLPLTIKEIQAGYLRSSFFKDLYVYMAQNKLPSKKSAICKVLTLSQSYVLLDELLFKLITVPDRVKALLAIPKSCTDKIISLYHNSLFAEHKGVIKTYLKISSKFFIPNLMHYLRAF